MPDRSDHLPSADRLPCVAFTALLVAALSMALSFAHLMELAPRLRWPPELWIAATVRGAQYWMFGTLGAAIDVGAVVLAALLAWQQRRQSGFRIVLAGAVLLALGIGLWWAVVYPMNLVLAGWAGGDGVPADFAAVRNRWEAGHAVIAIVKLLALGLLLYSAPALRRRGPPRRPDGGT